MGTPYPAKGTKNPSLRNPQGTDFGADNKLRVQSASGTVELPKNTRGLNGAEKFGETLEWCLANGDNIIESPSVGSSGAEPEMVRDIVAASPHKLYVLSARAIKNHLKDYELPKPDDTGCAKLIYEIATATPERLREWRYIPKDEKLTREHKTVRPYDKRNYKDPQVDAWMSLLPPFSTLPPDMQEIFTNGLKRHPDYARARVLPFAMALTEPSYDGTRESYERIIGLYDHGYPSFYRRKTIDLMQHIAKKQLGVRAFSTVTKDQRKEAWKVTRCYIRRLRYMATMGTTYPAKGTRNPSLPNE